MSLQTRARWFTPRSSNRGFFSPCCVLMLHSPASLPGLLSFKPLESCSLLLRNNTRSNLIGPPSTSFSFSPSRHAVTVYQETRVELIQARTANLRHREIDLATQNTDRFTHPRNSTSRRAVE